MATVYKRRNRLSSHQQAHLIEHFYMRQRHLIASKQRVYKLSGKIEVDDSFIQGMEEEGHQSY